MSGGDSEEVTPVPISNTEVKLFSADGSWGIPPARAGRCQAIKIVQVRKKPYLHYYFLHLFFLLNEWFLF